MTTIEKPTIQLRTGDERIDRVYALAIDTLCMNIHPWKDGLLDEEAPAIMAGEFYTTPWTRDCAYNVWNAGAMLTPEPAYNTLLSTLMQDDDLVRIGGQYWDAIVWVTGAWAYYCAIGDDAFLPLAHAATTNTLRYFEETEFDVETGLFEGPASYGDGVAAYPAPYDDADGSSGILDWPAAHPDIGKNRMKVLSTNCLYYNAYRIAALMSERLGLEDSQRADCQQKAQTLRDAINKHLWLPDKKRYAYYLDHIGLCDDYSEGLGQALAILTGVASDDQARGVLASQHVTDFGIPCVWPLFPRFQSDDGSDFGRHCGTIWPFIQGYWADAACRYDNLPVFEKELDTLAEMADRHDEFKEIYHPVTGEPYGGLQIDKGKMRLWRSEPNQTWSATGYLRMIHAGLFGMTFEPDALQLNPTVPGRFTELHLGPISYRDMTLEITIRGAGTTVKRCLIDGEKAKPTIDASLIGTHKIEIEME